MNYILDFVSTGIGQVVLLTLTFVLTMAGAALRNKIKPLAMALYICGTLCFWLIANSMIQGVTDNPVATSIEILLITMIPTMSSIVIMLLGVAAIYPQNEIKDKENKVNGN